MTKISATLVIPDEKSAATRQADAANQRESWLRQMELAQLAEMGKAGATQERSGARAAPAAPATLRPMPQAQAAVKRDDRDEQADAPQAAAAERMDEAGQQGSGSVRADAEGANAAAPRAASEAGARHDAAATDDAAATAQPVAQQASALALGPAAGAPHDPAILFAPAAATPAPGASDAGLAPTAAAAAAAGRSGALQLASEGAAPVLPPVAAREPVRLSVALAAKTRDGDGHEAAPARQGADSDAELGDRPVWEKRLMHLTGKGKDVDVWIRDGELDPAQSMSLLYRLAGDMASAGLRLKGATVNGKPLLRPGDALPANARPVFAQALDTEDTGTQDNTAHNSAAHERAAPLTPTGIAHGTR